MMVSAPGVRAAVRGAALAVAIATSSAQAAPPDPRPNVLLITIDTLRADRLGSYGYSLETSPNIDRLAAQAVVFERAIAASSATVPSHASIMVSQYPREHTVGTVNGATRLKGGRTLAERFRAAGYATGAFVGNAVLSRRVALDRGFDVYDDQLTKREANRGAYFERDADATTARALNWLEHQRGPLFAWVHYQDPHGPYAPPARFTGRFTIPSPPGEPDLPILSGNSGWGGIPAYQKLKGLTKPSQYEGRYADEIFYADQAIGRLVAALDAHASQRPAIVLLTADHGEQLGEDDRYFVHGITTTPPTAWVPLIVRAPDLAPGRRTDIASHVDILPTLLDLAGLEPAADARGVSLRQPAPADRFVFCDIGAELSAYRGDAFVRVLGAEGAWRPAAEHDDPLEDALWLRQSWPRAGRWQRQATAAEPDPAIRSYASHAVPIEQLVELSPSYRESLKALGYVIP